MKTVTLTCFTDVLCVWAWIGELRLAEVRRTHGEAVAMTQRFCNVFGATALKIQANWGAKGGYDGFAGHLAHVLEGFPELTASPDLWRRVRPASSLPAHLALKAVQAQAAEGGDPDLGDRSIVLIRQAFFEQGRDISAVSVLDEVLADAGANLADVHARLARGEAHAALMADYQEAQALGVKGSPSLVLNEGRQTLYGNVGFRVIEANIAELLREPQAGSASWC
ncbi:DsbA family protein [Phenylobacterium sp.]|uniref:DsbA family oxidoreductase n=1 Tax=Phenylobacterium sp. TaxID=1871053 RepID=UPI0025E28FC0|nr:DsbA family protein [Phenylobacterium sp.]MCA6249447.1 DsbA family protein [Phenylobacterium sp.]MCA6265306.1 DsbA family protein [Phenylobacterium sp.]MCA6274446.1 DsbA family protein [Phenylobacterium sp.]